MSGSIGTDWSLHSPHPQVHIEELAAISEQLRYFDRVLVQPNFDTLFRNSVMTEVSYTLLKKRWHERRLEEMLNYSQFVVDESL